MWYTTTLIFKIYRNWDKFEESFDHNMRVGDIQNAMPGLSDRNILLLGSLDDSLADTVMVRIAHDLKSGESYVLGFEVILGVSLDFFLKTQKDLNLDSYSYERLHKWIHSVHKWGMNVFYGLIVSSNVHLDEVTPHVHILCLTGEKEGKKSFSKLLKRKELQEILHDSYALAVKHLGIERADKENIESDDSYKDNIYTEDNALQDTDYIDCEIHISIYSTPSLLKKLFFSKDTLLEHIDQTIANYLELDYCDLFVDWELLKDIAKENTFSQNVSDSSVSTLADILYDEEEDLLEPKDLGLLQICRYYHNIWEDTNHYFNGLYKIMDNFVVQASYKHWEDIFTGAMGRDSLTFIIYFKGYDTKDHHQALKDLENLLDFDRLELNLLSFLSLKKHPIITRLLTHGYEGPIFVELSFQKIKGDLEDHYKIGAKALNIFHFLGTLGADTLGNVILCSLRPKKDKDGWWLNTFFRADIGQNLLFLNLEEDKLPFFLPGYDYDISLVRYALLALKMKFDFPFLSIMVFSFLRDSFSSSPLKFYFGDRVLRLRKDMLDPSEKTRLTILKRLEVKNPLKKP